MPSVDAPVTENRGQAGRMVIDGMAQAAVLL
jgi:hypothetical protein